MRFSYNSGQRPLVGYTLKRGVGRGGFGEVYFAISDGGKEVALKLVRADSREVELRGMQQCLNLKHPNLVALYDLRKDAQGNHWVVMEYVAGEPLNVVVARHQGGVPIELAREWFLGLARAVAYLHDHGIVHRDLKPANIFLENGVVKVGDYGLSKLIGGSQRTTQTENVGTVHYMAPEIKNGNYTKQIDIYAAGVMLYELLTGKKPFDGDSAGEILMKHLTAPPEWNKVPAEYLPILQKALAKNPNHRFASMAEFARAVEAVGQPRSRSSAERAAVPVARPATSSEPILDVVPAVTLPQQLSELTGALVLSVLFTGLGTLLWAAVFQVPTWGQFGSVFFLTVAACWAVLVPGKFWTDRPGDSWSRRLVMLCLGIGIGALGVYLDGWWGRELPVSQALERPPSLWSSGLLVEAGYLSFYGVGLFALRWWRMTDRQRTQRFDLLPLLAAAVVGGLLQAIIRPPTWGVVVLILASIVVQLVSPVKRAAQNATPRKLKLKHA